MANQNSQNTEKRGPEAYRVIQWSTGGVGSRAIRAIASRPDLELIGVWVHSEKKAGKDAGVLMGMDPLGVVTTKNSDALLEMDADCVCYTAAGADTGAQRLKECIDEFCTILESGKNIVTTSITGLTFPKGFDAAATERLEASCRAGRSSLFASGIEPGFAGDLFPLTLLTMSERVTSVRTQEIFNYAGYPVAFVMSEVFGFGKPTEYKPLITAGGMMTSMWGPSVQMVAHGLGAQIDEIRETFETEVTDKEVEVAWGKIEPGTVGAVRFETVGVINGRDAIVIEHVNRISDDIAPHWATAPDGTYRVIIEGMPNITCDFQVGSHPGDDHTEHGMTATAMRIVNAIPAVCEADPGLVSALDLPLTTPRHVLVA
jgi:hypothetical protein